MKPRDFSPFPHLGYKISNINPQCKCIASFVGLGRGRHQGEGRNQRTTNAETIIKIIIHTMSNWNHYLKDLSCERKI